MFVCSGNAARSVMAGAALSAHGAPAAVRTAGTHVVEGQPLSRRTREAMGRVGLSADGHRSHQLTDADLRDADLVVAFAAEHVLYVRRRHPDAAARTGTLRRLSRDLQPGSAPLSDRVSALGLEGVELDPSEDVEDPASGDEAVLDRCTREVVSLVDQLAQRLS